MSSDYAESARKRKLARQAPAPEGPPTLPPAPKNTRKWCRGKVGRTHQPKCFLAPGPIQAHYGDRELACIACGKQLAYWRAARPWKILRNGVLEDWPAEPKPDWVDC